MKKINIKFKKVNKDAKIPLQAHLGDAGMDLISTENYILPSNANHAFSTGICMEIPFGYAGFVMERSGLALKEKIMVMGGVIDSGYRGEIKVILYNAGKKSYEFKAGDKLAQIVIQKVEQPEIVEVSELSDASRMDKGFGSSGR
jgi:dUTP pyrophosphatase